MVPPRRARTVPWGIVGLTSGAVVVLGSVIALRARSADPAPEPSASLSTASLNALDTPMGEPAASSAGGGVAAPVARDLRSQILSKTNLVDAISVARPSMVNTVGRVDTGSALLSLWAAGNMTWEALDAIPATSSAMFNKDPDSERGKRLCITGTILEVRAERSLAGRLVDDRSMPLISARPYAPPAAPPAFPGDVSSPPRPQDSSGSFLLPLDAQGAGAEWTIPDDGKVYVAMIREKQAQVDDGSTRTFRKPNRDELLVEIIAAKSTGALVNRSEARACGILTGVTLPSTSSATLPPDVTEHRIVGMFDLPQNRGGSQPARP